MTTQDTWQRIATTVSSSTYGKLVELALQNERSLAFEIRKAVERHVGEARSDG